MPLVVTAEDISSAITRINGAAQGVNAVVQSCTALPASTVAAWNDWYTNYQAWAAENSNLGYFTLGLPEIGNQAVGYENDVAGWQTQVNKICNSGLPVFTPEPEVAEQNVGGGWITAAKWIAAAVIVVVVVPPIVSALSTAKGAMPHRTPARRREERRARS